MFREEQIELEQERTRGFSLLLVLSLCDLIPQKSYRVRSPHARPLLPSLRILKPSYIITEIVIRYTF